jgi:hypothetical protein
MAQGYDRGRLNAEHGFIQQAIASVSGVVATTYAVQPGEQGVVDIGYQPGDIRRYGADGSIAKDNVAIPAAMALHGKSSNKLYTATEFDYIDFRIK